MQPKLKRLLGWVFLGGLLTGFLAGLAGFGAGYLSASSPEAADRVAAFEIVGFGVFGLIAVGVSLWVSVYWMRTIDEARDAALDALPGTQAVDAVISADGRAALVLLSDARIALVRTRGRRVSGREVAWPMLRQTYDGIVVETGDRRFGDVALVG
ncbi:hypothetical protein LTR94_031764, partial [Friedmanniomyces endolithicus]